MNSPGNPKPDLEWILDDKPVTEGAYIMTMIHDITDREYHGCLQLDSPTHLNNGHYTLVAKNEFGMDHKAVEAHFMLKPWEGEESRSARLKFVKSGNRDHCVIDFNFLSTHLSPWCAGTDKEPYYYGEQKS